MARVVIGLSGGVDSSVAAYLLKSQGHDVTALFMINWHETEGTLAGDCPWEDDVIFARLVARKLDIPFYVTDLSSIYRKRVVDYMFSEYSKGRTPNPDVLCNREIKFEVFVEEALKYGAEYVATGHYCRKETLLTEEGPVYRLLAGVDTNKDQSYFLCQLSQEQLSRALFPIGSLQKSEVRTIAEEHGLASAKKKDSQGICFVGKVDLPLFLQQQLKPWPGSILEIAPEEVPIADLSHDISLHERLLRLSEPYCFGGCPALKVGEHEGAHFYTIGQRKGLRIGGRELPSFVLSIDVDNNIVYTGQGEKHPGLYHRALRMDAAETHWVRPDMQIAPGNSLKVRARIRYRQPLQEATLYAFETDYFLDFETPQKSVAPGQFAAWYVGEEVVGSGVIA